MTHTKDEAKAATPHHNLIAELLNPNIPKTEREHAASREIERLQALTLPVQEPVAWHVYFGNEDEPNYAEIATPNAKPHEPRAVIRPLIFGDKNPKKLTNQQKIDMTEEFNKWWNEDDLLSENNPYLDGSPVCWAWEGWLAALAVPKQAVAWEGMTKNTPHAGAPKMIFTDKKIADEWLSGFTDGHAWLEPMYK